MQRERSWPDIDLLTIRRDGNTESFGVFPVHVSLGVQARLPSRIRTKVSKNRNAKPINFLGYAH